MDEKNNQIAHRRIVAGRGTLKNGRRNNNFARHTIWGLMPCVSMCVRLPHFGVAASLRSRTVSECRCVTSRPKARPGLHLMPQAWNVQGLTQCHYLPGLVSFCNSVMVALSS